MSAAESKPWMLGMKPLHLHDSHGLCLCAGNGDRCNPNDLVAEPSVCDWCKGKIEDYDNPHPHQCKHCGGGTTTHASRKGQTDQARFKRLRDCVNGSVDIPDPKGVPAMLDLIWGMAHDEKHEGHEAAKQALIDMGFFRDEENVAGELMA